MTTAAHLPPAGPSVCEPSSTQRQAAAPALLLSTAPFFRRSVQDAFRSAADAGFAGVEVMVAKDPDSQRADRLGDLAIHHDLAIGALHAPFLALTRGVFTSDPIQKVVRTVSLARDLSVPLVVAHPPYRWQHGYRHWLRTQAPALSTRSGVIITVENMYPLGPLAAHRHHRSEHLERYPDLTLDTSHAAVSGLALESAPSEYAECLRHVHLSDNLGKGWDSHRPVGEGVLPIGAFLGALREAPLIKSISLELDLRRWMDDRGDLRTALRSQRTIVEGLLPQPSAVAHW